MFHSSLLQVRKSKVQVDSRLPEVTREVLRAKGHLTYVPHSKRKRYGKERSQIMDTEMGEGLGSLPRHLPSVSSLLLFNTAENPYKKYVLLDPLEGAKTKTRDKIEEENELSDAPITITQGEELGRAQQDSLMYVPLMPELSQLDVPEMLPQLAYVASDVFYSADVGASIAPSLANATVPDLPNLADPEAPAAAETPLPPPTGTEPPPPPPPSAPAPPPPPMAAPPLPAVGEESSDEEASEQPPADSGDGRANLMEAIRKAGESVHLVASALALALVLTQGYTQG
jgi:WAS family protein 1